VELRAQGTIGGLPVVSLQTGSGDPIVTGSQSLILSGDGEQKLDFSFGFGTTETAAAGQFFDSFTGTLQVNGDPSRTAIFFTVDANGMVWAPFSPGAFLLDASAFTANPQVSHSLGANYPQQWVYRVVVPVPSQFNGSAATFYWDLADNHNLAASQAWFSSVTIVPEPGTLVLLGLGSWCLWRRRARIS
jgi:hypothetical protein